MFFFSKGKAADFNVGISNDNNFKSFKYKIWGNTVV